MKSYFIYVKFGKKDFIRIDLVDSISNYLKLSKSKVKRVFDSGGVDLLMPETIKPK